MTTAPATLADLHELTSRPGDDVLAFLRTIEGNVAVLGAGGKMGYHLARMLHRGFAEIGAGNRVVAVSRFGSPDATGMFDEAGIETIRCDLTDANELSRLPDFPNLYYMAGIKFGTSDNPELLEKFNVTMPRLVAERFRDARIVALSTGCVYPFVPSDSGGSLETDAADPSGAYAESCAGREGAFIDSGVRCVLVRLNYSVDLRYGVLVDVAQKVFAGIPIDVTMGYANVIWQGDATAHIIRSLALAATPAVPLNITGTQTLAIRDVAIRFGELFQKPAEITGNEAPTAWLNNASKSHQLFGTPSVGENQLIEMVADWIARDGETLGKPTHFEVRDGNY